MQRPQCIIESQVTFLTLLLLKYQRYPNGRASELGGILTIPGVIIHCGVHAASPLPDGECLQSSSPCIFTLWSCIWHCKHQGRPRWKGSSWMIYLFWRWWQADSHIELSTEKELDKKMYEQIHLLWPAASCFYQQTASDAFMLATELSTVTKNCKMTRLYRGT